jgi:hypothetical protein
MTHCICTGEITFNGVRYTGVHSAACEMPGHGIHTRFVSEHATTPASAASDGKKERNGRDAGHTYQCRTNHHGLCKNPQRCPCSCHKEKA